MSTLLSRRVRLALTGAVILAAALTGACSNTIVDSYPSPLPSPATPSSKPSSGTSGTPNPSGTDPTAQAEQTLARYLGSGERDCIVRVGDGFDAAVYDDSGHLRFYVSPDGRTWQHLGTDLGYRYDARDAAGQHLRVEGTVLPGMRDATFILHGVFTGDGSGNAMAYAPGPQGWGPLVRPGGPNGPTDATKLLVGTELPPADSYDQVSFYQLAFADGALVETACDQADQNANCGAAGTTTRTRWVWNSQEQDFRPAA